MADSRDFQFHPDLTGAQLHIPKVHITTHYPGGSDPMDYSAMTFSASGMSAITLQGAIEEAFNSGSSGATWGSIIGTLASQTDLQVALDAKEDDITAGTTAQYWRGDKSWQTLNTSIVPESTNLYYTQARFDTAFGLKSTADLAELTNLYYTDARARVAISETVVGLDYNSSTGILSLTTGYVIPTTTEEANWNDAYGKRVDTWGNGLAYSSQVASVDYNTTNLKITSEQLNTIQDIATSSSPTFSSLTISTAPTEDGHATRKDWVLAQIATENLWDRESGAVLVPHTANDNINIGSGGFTTTGLVDLGSLVVDTTTLVVNATGYADKVGIGTATPSAELDVIGNTEISGYVRIGTDTTYETFYQEEGDLYSGSGKAYFGSGLNTVAERYGVGLQIREQTLTKTLVYDIDATFTAATGTVYKSGQTFVSNGVVIGDFLVVTNANDTSYIGSTGEIISVTQETIVVNIAAAGTDVPSDLTDFDFVVLNHPICSILDNGDIHFKVGVSSTAGFHILSPTGASECALFFDLTTGVAGHNGICIDFDAVTFGGTSAIGLNYDASSFSASDTIGTGIDVVVNNTGATNGDMHVIDVALSDPTNTSLEVEAIATGEGVDVIGQYLGDPAALDAGFSYDTSIYNDRTVAFNSAGTDVQIFVSQNDYIYLAATSKWDQINVALAIQASHNIIPTFEYVETDGGWVVFTPADDTNGFQQNGAIRFESDNLTTWGQRTVFQVTGKVGAINYYWIRIRRTRKILPTPPTEDTIQLTTLGAKFYWNKTGDTFQNTMAVTDGVTAPSNVTGQAIIYVDTADGDLKVKFADGHVATIASDS